MTATAEIQVRPRMTKLGLALLAVAVSLSGTALQAAEDEPQLLVMERRPFDRVVLNAANKNAAIEVELLDLPGRRVPNPKPTSGLLQVNKTSNPSIKFQIQWSQIDKVLLYERMILDEAIQLTRDGKLLEASRCLMFLHKYYPDMEGLDRVSEQFLLREAVIANRENKHEESLAILLALYDMNPDYSGLANAVMKVSNSVIKSLWDQREFDSARSVLEVLKQSFPKLKLTNVTGWEQRFGQGAGRFLETAKRALADGEYDQARTAIRNAIDILPAAPGAMELLAEIDRRAPRTIIAVHQLVGEISSTHPLLLAESRISQLVAPQLIDMVDFGSEGGIYRSRWAALESDDSGMQFDISFSPEALNQGFSPERLALSLLTASDPRSSQYATDFADAFDHVAISDGQVTSVSWQRPHIRPEALLRMRVAEVVSSSRAPGVFVASPNPDLPSDMHYDLPLTSGDSNRPRRIIERTFESSDDAILALRTGEINAVDRVAPWEADLLKNDRNVEVGTYRLPTVHVLRMNFNNPLLKRREFRRSLCYGIDRQRIVDEVLLAGSNRPGFRVLSGPLPAGASYTDPIAYAYNQQLPPRPYDPRLSSVLSTVARNALVKPKEKGSEASDDTDNEDSADAEEDQNEAEEPNKELPPLKLAHPPNDAARTCCQMIQLQLTAVGIPIELVELPQISGNLPEGIDLIYTELYVREPLVDARQLLGPDGLAGICSSSMTMTLDRVDKSKNWSDATERLQEVHQIAHDDLPVIPLWQTIDQFAYLNTLRGIGEEPVSLYQNVSQWRSAPPGGRR